jgi:hypothetical protein
VADAGLVIERQSRRGQPMTRAFESWWWTTIMVALLVFWGVFFPSESREEPRMFVATHLALAVSMAMCVMTLGAWFIRVHHRAR